MSPDSIETRVGVLGERIDQVSTRLANVDQEVRKLGGVVAQVSVIEDRFQQLQAQGAAYRADVRQSLDDMRATQQRDYDHFTQELEDRDEKLAKAEKERASSKRTTWFTLAGLMIAFAAMLVTLLSTLSTIH